MRLLKRVFAPFSAVKDKKILIQTRLTLFKSDDMMRFDGGYCSRSIYHVK